MDENPQPDTPIQPQPEKPLNSEETLLKSAASDIEAADDQPQHYPGIMTPPKKSHKKLWITLFVIVLLVAAAGAAWLLKGKSDKSDTQQKPSAIAQPESTKSYLPDLVAYGFKADQSSAMSIYYRPSVGGERKEALKLGPTEYPSTYDTQGNLALFVINSSIYLSKDGGRTYDVVFEDKDAGPVVSAKLSSDGKRVAFTILSNTNSQDSVMYSVDLTGKDKQEITKLTGKAMYLLAWNATKQKAMYAEGCYGCDGGRSAYKLYDLKTKSAKDLLPGVDVQSVQFGLAISDDMTKLVYVTSTVDTSIKVDGLPGYYSAAPYNVRVVDLDTLKPTTVKTIGTKQEKNANGTLRYRQFSVGFMAGTNTAFYSDGQLLNEVEGDKSSLLYQADAPITKVHYASTKSVLVATEKTINDYILSNYDLTTKKSVQIFEGDTNTVVFGVTTK